MEALERAGRRPPLRAGHPDRAISSATSSLGRRAPHGLSPWPRPPLPGPRRLRALTDEYLALAARLREGGGPDSASPRCTRRGSSSPARAGASAARSRHARGSRSGCSSPTTSTTARRPAPASSPGVGVVRGARGGGGGQRRDGEGGLLVAGDDHEDPAGAGSRDAPADPDHLPGGLRRREPALPGRRLPRAVRRGAHLLLQLAHAALPARAADQRGHGQLHRRRRLPAGAVRRDLHGRGHQLHGAGRPQPGEGRHRPDGRRRDARRRDDAHRSLSAVAHYRAADRSRVPRA